MRLDEFKKDLQKAASLVGTAQRMAREGKVVDLSALEGHITHLCEKAPVLDDAAHAEIRPLMLALSDDLDRLYKDIAIQHGELERQLRDLSRSNEAIGAYGQTQRMS